MRKRELDVGTELADQLGHGRDPQFITALSRGLDVLRAFRRGDSSLGNQELARRTSLPKPTVSRITYTLTRLGYLSYLPDIARYKLSVGVLALGYTSLGSFGILDIARPLMQEMADATGMPVALGTRDGLSMVYLAVCKGQSPFTLALETGSHIKLSTSAMGRACLAAMPIEERDLLLPQMAKHEGRHWPRLGKGIEKACREFEEKDFVTSAGDWKPDVNAAGAPIFLNDGRAEFVLNCGGSAFLVSAERLETEIGPALADLAKGIAKRMEQN